MVLATTELKLNASATLMLLNAENWKESLRMFNIVKCSYKCSWKSVTYYKFESGDTYSPKQTTWWPQKPIHICLKEEVKLQTTFCQWAVQEHVYCKYKQPSSKTKICPQSAVWNFSARHCSRTWVLIWRYVRYMFQGPLPWVLWWLRLAFHCCCLQSSSM